MSLDLTDITFGRTWKQRFVTGEYQSNKITSVKEKPYGYRIQMFNNYITLYYVKLIVNLDGSAKAHVRIKRNYSPTQRFTYYFAPDGREIKDRLNRTKKELKVYKALRAEFLNLYSHVR